MRTNVRMVSDEVPLMQIARKQRLDEEDRKRKEREQKGKRDFDTAADMLGRLLILLAIVGLCIAVAGVKYSWWIEEPVVVVVEQGQP